ncbi:hypothetical protein [Methanosarcina mazei]|uniref:Uncharacterized protein n=2 Tax=Methanosarcina mazei TaxID=2209 RepID=A0A0F8IK58_METMZ|nr:hypothetical protein [Methanosarcina mazei]AKB61761.1 hypothetical protein MSMAP_1776 [Methanosarcina mazei SarPi]KKG79809.1 hypothetical protein DU55_13125 [Methanosarcina mazei]
MSKTTLEEIKNYIDNEIKEDRVRIGFEDVNGEVSPLTFIFKRMVSGFMLIKSEHSQKIRTEPIYLGGELNEISYEIESYEEVIGTIPAINCYAVFCIVPDRETFENVKECSYNVKTVLLGFENPNGEHPDWIEEYKKLFVASFDYEGKEDQEDFYYEEIEESEKAEMIKEFLKKCKKMESGDDDE